MTNAHRTSLALIVVALLALIVYRSVSGFFSPLPLQVDEAQYLGWSRDLAFGYYSKPPVIAWVLGLNRAACEAAGIGGFMHIEGCARMLQPIALGLAAFFAAATSWALFQSKAAAGVTALLLLTSPLFGFYSLFATTDAWLLVCWAFALWSFVYAVGIHSHVRPSSGLGRHRLGFWILCGAAVGVGLLAKYSMGVFVISALIAVLVRRQLMTPGPWVAAITAAAVFSPNLVWNAQHHFPTFAHHLEISQVQSASAHVWSITGALGSLAEFSAAQFLLLGPFALIAVFLFLPRMMLGDSLAQTRQFKLLLIFALPMLAIILVQATMSRAHANWAAPAYLSIAIVVGQLWAARDRFDINARLGPLFLWLSVGFGLLVTLVLIHGLKFSYHEQGAPKIRAVEQLRGWREAAQSINALARERQAVVIAQDRRILAALQGYTGRPIAALDLQNRRSNHYTWFYNLTDQSIDSDQWSLAVFVGESDTQPAIAALRSAGFSKVVPAEGLPEDLRLGAAKDKLFGFWIQR